MFPVYIWWTVYSLYVTMRIAKSQPVATAPSASAYNINDPNTSNNLNLVDIPLPAYDDVVPGILTKSSTKISTATH